MSDANFTTLLDTLFDAAGIDDGDRCYDNLCRDLFSDDCDDFREIVELATEKHSYERLEGDYGGEGEGEYCYGIISIDGKFYRADWSYYSYNGCEFDGIHASVCEVKATTEMVTVYR